MDINPNLVKAILDFGRRERDLPGVDEMIEAKARRELDRRKAEAALGLTEARAESLPAEQEMRRRVQESTIGRNEASAEAARALAEDRSRVDPMQPIEVSPGASLTLPGEGGAWETVYTAPERTSTSTPKRDEDKVRTIATEGPNKGKRVTQFVDRDTGRVLREYLEQPTALESASKSGVRMTGPMFDELGSLVGALQNVNPFTSPLQYNNLLNRYNGAAGLVATTLKRASGDTRLSDLDMKTARKYVAVDPFTMWKSPELAIETIEAARRLAATMAQLDQTTGPEQTSGIPENSNAESPELGGIDPEVQDRLNLLFPPEEEQ